MDDKKEIMEDRMCLESVCPMNKDGVCLSIMNSPKDCKVRHSTIEPKEISIETKPKQIPRRRFLDFLPDPKKVLSLIMIGILIGLLVKFWPFIIVSIFGDFSQRNPTDVSPVIFALFAVIALLVVMLLGVWNCRGVWWPFWIASWTNGVIYMGFTKNKLISFVRPKEINWNHTRLDGESTIDVDPNSRYTAPNRVPVYPFIPDYAKTFDPREVVLNKQYDLSIDINTLDNIGTLNYIKGIKKMTNPLSSFLSGGMLWLLIAAGVLFLVMWPYFTQQMNNSNQIASMQSGLLQCNQELVAHGLTPAGVQTTTTVATTLPANVAQPGGSVKTIPSK
jgi:hypothetical protein